MRQRLSVCLLAMAGAIACAPSAEAAAKQVTKVNAEFTKDGKEQVKIFDLDKKADKEQLAELAREGHLHFLEPYQPALDLISWDLGLWTVVIFVLLLWILKKSAWGPILEGLQKREDTIRAAVEEAKVARAETERVRAEFKAEMAKAYEQIPKMMDEARRDAQAVADEMRAQAQKDILAERQRVRREMDRALEQGLQELTQHTAQLATLISAKAIRRSLTEDDHRRLVDEALTELRQAKS